MKAVFALQTLWLGKTPEFNIPFLCFEDAEDVENTTQQDLASPQPCLVYLEHWREVWSTLEHACRTVIECADLWKDVSKNLGKRRALSELLKLLESCGLSRHKSIFFWGSTQIQPAKLVATAVIWCAAFVINAGHAALSKCWSSCL